MFTFRDNGDVEIEGFEGLDGAVVIHPPKYGALKRLRAERERIADRVGDKLLALEPIEEIPPAKDDESLEEKQNRTRIVRLHRDRVIEINELNAGSLVDMWHFIIHGDDSFKGLAEPSPPKVQNEDGTPNVDGWPGGLMYDVHEPISIADGQLSINESALDRVFRHWGKVHYRSGPSSPTPG